MVIRNNHLWQWLVGLLFVRGLDGQALTRARSRRQRAQRQEQEITQALHRVLAGSVQRTQPPGIPNLDPLAMALREIQNMRWDIKVLGSALAEHLYKARVNEAVAPPRPAAVPLTSKLCCQDDIEQDWLRYWLTQLHMAPVYHRKVWEDAFVMQALWNAEMLQQGRRGLGFAVGAESLPSYLASRDVDVLATDLDPADDRATVWANTAQHTSHLSQIFRPNLVNEHQFKRRCEYRSVDMNDITPELHGQFDFCWSVCALEHLGSIENGLAFIENSVLCLKPGGVAVHTTEFNLDDSGETIDQWPTVLFQRRHFEDLSARLAAHGHTLLAIDYNPGSGLMDRFVDLPPYASNQGWQMSAPTSPHLRLSIDGFAVTSIGLIIRAA
jgi:SAM-dependent methyltransferase